MVSLNTTIMVRISILQFSLLTVDVHPDVWEQEVSFFLSLGLDLAFEDPTIQIADLKVTTGLYIRLVANKHALQPQGIAVSLAVPDVALFHQQLSEEQVRGLSRVNQVPEMEQYFSVTSPAGFVIRFTEHEHGPPEWKESLVLFNKRKAGSQGKV